MKKSSDTEDIDKIEKDFSAFLKEFDAWGKRKKAMERQCFKEGRAYEKRMQYFGDLLKRLEKDELKKKKK